MDTEGYNGHDRREGRTDWTSLAAWARAIREVGIVGSIAIGLVYVGATQVPKIATALAELTVEVRAVQRLISEHVAHQEKILRATQKACWHAARDDDGRKGCYE